MLESSACRGTVVIISCYHRIVNKNITREENIMASVASIVANLNTTRRDAHVGDGVTFIYWSDRPVGTVVRVETPNRCVVQEDRVVADETGAHAVSITPDPDAPETTLVRTRKGWKVKGEPIRVVMGKRDYYYDIGF